EFRRVLFRSVFVDELQRALALLSLVRGVGAVELTARGDGPYGSRNMVLVRAGPDEAQRPAVGARALLHEPSDLHLVHGLGYAGERLDAQRRRDLIKQLLRSEEHTSELQSLAYLVCRL